MFFPSYDSLYWNKTESLYYIMLHNDVPTLKEPALLTISLSNKCTRVKGMVSTVHST